MPVRRARPSGEDRKGRGVGNPTEDMHNKLKYGATTMFVALFCMALGACKQQYTEVLKHKSLLEMTTSSIIWNEEPLVLEYGSTMYNPLDNVDYVEKTSENVHLKTDVQEISCAKLGKTEVKYTLYGADKFNQSFEKTTTRVFEVKDTTPPVIKLKQKEITVDFGASYDPKTNIESCADPVDGEVLYEIEGSVDTNTPGEYQISVKAKDKNGNTAKESFTVKVNKKPVVQSNASYYGGASMSNAVSSSTSSMGDAGRIEGTGYSAPLYYCDNSNVQSIIDGGVAAYFADCSIIYAHEGHGFGNVHYIGSVLKWIHSDGSTQYLTCTELIPSSRGDYYTDDKQLCVFERFQQGAVLITQTCRGSGTVYGIWS